MTSAINFDKPADAAGAFARLDMVAIDDRHAGGIVAAVFEPAQPINQDGRGLRSTDISNDATHKIGGSVTPTLLPDARAATELAMNDVWLFRA